MDERVMIKVSRRIEYLVHKRHRSLRHIQRTVQEEGAFWMNSVRLDRKTVMKVIQQSFTPSDLKVKIERFYHLGFSLGKIIDLGNAVNTIYTLLQLFEEFEVFTMTKMDKHLEQNAILRHILPQSIEPFAKLQNAQELKHVQLEDYVDTLSLSTVDSFQGGTDHLETVRKPGMLQEVSSPSHLRGQHIAQLQLQNEETKIDLKYKSTLPVSEQHFNNLDDYIMKTSAMSSQLAAQSGDQNSTVAKIHAHKVDPKAPSFRILSCSAVPFQLNYCEVAQSLIDMLILTYNKMYDNQYLSPQMLLHIERIDSIIVNKVIKALCEDINKVARVIALKQLAKINKVMKMDTVPAGRNTELRRVPSDDMLYDIPPVDFDGKDQQLLQQLAVNHSNMASSMRVSSDRNGDHAAIVTGTYRA